jgi:hypothetical protein
MLGSLSPANTIPMLGLLLRVRVPETVKQGACALSNRTFIASEHGSDARLRNNKFVNWVSRTVYKTFCFVLAFSNAPPGETVAKYN